LDADARDVQAPFARVGRDVLLDLTGDRFAFGQQLVESHAADAFNRFSFIG
jgi:hypothetical protein